MTRAVRLLALLIAAASGTPILRADEPSPSAEAIRAAIARSIPLLEQGAAGSAEQRTCFTCHNQALPVLALVEAQNRGFTIDAKNLQRQIQHTADHLAGGRQNYLEGRGQGGRVATAGYALWTLATAGWEPDETTSAVAAFLLDYQQDLRHWRHRGNRPPSQGSDFTATYVALRGLSAFGTAEQRPAIDARFQSASAWLATAAPVDTEDRVFRLRALEELDNDAVESATRELLDTQCADGGWSQLADMQSDAYATGSALAALIECSGLAPDAPAVTRGVRYLLDTQLEDGSWHVVTRAEPFQTYYESGFPHGEDQFISIAASSWATWALLLALPDDP